jgi:quercetin dioxygenase-like cupin family protein
MSHLRVAGLMLVVLFMPFAARLSDAAEEPVVTPLLLKELPDISGKEALMITVNYPPGGADPIHRHDAHAFVYVLEGSIVCRCGVGKR